MMLYCTLQDGKPIRYPCGEVQFHIYTDVIVAGVGTAGSAAMLQLSEWKIDCIGIEVYSMIGGSTSVGLVWNYFHGSPGHIEYHTVDENVFVKNASGENGYLRAHAQENTIRTNGGKLLLNARIIGVYADSSEDLLVIKGVHVLKDGQEVRIAAKVLIDSTGDAYAHRMVDCAVPMGRKLDGRGQYESILALKMEENHIAYTDISYAGRGAHILEGMASIAQRMEKTVALSPAQMRGIREGIRAKTEYTIALKDALFCQNYEDGLFAACSNVDSISRDIALESELIRTWHGICNMWDVSVSCIVPVRALKAACVRNLLAAGRMFGADHDVAALARMRSDMEKTGLATAAMAVQLLEGNKQFNAEAIRNKLHWTKPIAEIHDPHPENPYHKVWYAYVDQTTAHLDNSIQQTLYRGLLGDISVKHDLIQIVHARQYIQPTCGYKYYYPLPCASIDLLGRLKAVEYADALEKIAMDTQLSIGNAFPFDGFIPNEQALRFQYRSMALMALMEMNENSRCCRICHAQNFSLKSGHENMDETWLFQEVFRN